ncbi:conserved hypothetical protein [Cenarchaeum symbiosum A]|uniref:DUF5655 domain-containing protein n=1 Tax=Cenarchaeum symbiosum (strain A) TaxID=414004 RepID=A0RU32_CENSY|nr:conserved hypothetical protein [Cenarchaeum symbiosum A]
MFPRLQFLESEYTIDNIRPDSIVYDDNANSFAIIEYKNVRNKGVVDQGMSYYKLIKDRPSDFVLLAQKKKLNINREDVNWDEARIIFIAPEYTIHQRRAASLAMLPIELYRISKYEGGVFGLELLEKKTEGKMSTSVVEEYSTEKFLNGDYDNTGTDEDRKKLFYTIRKIIMERFPDIEFRQRKWYAGFHSTENKSYVCTISTKATSLSVTYSTKANLFAGDPFVESLIDELGKKKGNLGIGSYRSTIKSESDVEKMLFLVSKVYDDNKN